MKKPQHPRFKERSFGISVGSVLLLIAVGVATREAEDGGSIYDDPVAYRAAFGREPAAPNDSGAWSPEIIADVNHPDFAEHARRFERWQARQRDED